MSKHRKTFGSAEEMGRYFDEHEVTEENSTATTAVVEKRYDPTLTMRIPEEDLKKLKELADERGVPTATLGRMLLLERLRGEGAPREAALRLLETIGSDKGLRDRLRTVVQGRRLKSSARDEAEHPPHGTPRRSAKALCEHIFLSFNHDLDTHPTLSCPTKSLFDESKNRSDVRSCLSAVLYTAAIPLKDPDPTREDESEAEGVILDAWN